MIKINEAIEQILTSLTTDEYKDEVSKAFNIYKRPFSNFDVEIDIERGFNQWLIHDYKLSDGTKIAEKILTDKTMIDTIQNALYSVFKVHHEKNHIILKDVLTNKDYVLESDQLFEEGDLVCIRLYPVNNKYTVIDNPEFHDMSLETTIRKSVMSKYNEYCSSNEPMSIEVFIKEHSQLIYHLTNIIKYYENELEEEVDLSVFVAEFAIKEREVLLDNLLATDHFQIIETYEDEMILNVLDDGIQIGEAVVTHDRIEIETTSKGMLDIAKDILENCSEERAVFIKEGKMTIDDLLQ
ncbi:MAG: hypothetical protein JEZ08_21675 [Clostridiales bacterium]|nr:hypothetical protein [Clostridiales bacterium]